MPEHGFSNIKYYKEVYWQTENYGYLNWLILRTVINVKWPKQ